MSENFKSENKKEEQENDKMLESTASVVNLRNGANDFTNMHPKHTYASRKSYATGLLDIALITSNLAHIKQILKNKETTKLNGLDVVLLCLIALSLFMQLICGLWLLFLPIKKEFVSEEEKNKHQKRENVFTSLVLIITIINLFINVFISF